jgi:hypothetical protein
MWAQYEAAWLGRAAFLWMLRVVVVRVMLMLLYWLECTVLVFIFIVVYNVL